MRIKIGKRRLKQLDGTVIGLVKENIGNPVYQS
jgi:hypothetical protein